MADLDTDSPDVAYYQRRIRVGERVSLLLRLYAVLGVAIALVGAGFVIYSKLKIDLDPEEQLALAASFLGIMMAAASFGLLQYRRAIYERDVERFAEHQAVGRFIEAWVKFEEASASAAFGDSSEGRRASIREALRKLAKEGRLTVTDQIIADGLLQMRNAVVHGAKRFPASELERGLDQMVSLISKVS